MPSHPSQTTALPAYFGWIDATRGIAAISVVIFHYTHFYMAESGARPIQVALMDVPYSAVLWPFYQYGEVAVRLFWVISGFVFAHVYWSRDATVRDFAAARFARLYPLHIVTLLLVAGLQVFSMHMTGHWQVFGNNDLRHFVLQIFLLDHSLNLSDGLSFNGPIWSVSAEIFVYILFFVTLPLTKRRPLTVSLLFSIAAFGFLSVRPDGFIIAHWAFVCAVFFFAGSACFAIYRALRGKTSSVVTVALGLAVIAWVGFASGTSNVALIAACCAVILALAALETLVTGSGRIATFLGDISYSIYLVHIPIQIIALIIADVGFAGDRSFAQSHLTLPIYLLVSIGLAHITNIYFEKPAGRWVRNRLKRARPSSA